MLGFETSELLLLNSESLDTVDLAYGGEEEYDLPNTECETNKNHTLGGSIITDDKDYRNNIANSSSYIASLMKIVQGSDDCGKIIMDFTLNNPNKYT